MKRNLSARSVARILSSAALVLMLSACGSDPVPIPAPPPPNPNGVGGVANCPSVGGAQPVQTNGSPQGYYADLPAMNPTSAGDFVMSLFYQRVPTAGYQVENVVGSGAVKIPALTGYLPNNQGIIPVCVSSNNNSPGLLNVASGGVRIKMTGNLPPLPQGAIPGGPIPMGYPYGYQTNQSMGSVEVRVGWSCDAWIVPQGRVIGCIDVISYGYPGGSMSYRAQ